MEKFSLDGVDDIFLFGKYAGKSLKEVVEVELSYVTWCIQNVKNFYISEDTIKKIIEINPNFFVSEEVIEAMNNKYEAWIDAGINAREEAEISAREAMYEQWNIDVFLGH